MNKVDKAILEAVINIVNQKGRTIQLTKEDIFIHIYFSMKRKKQKPYSFETVARRLRVLAKKGYFYVRYKEEGNGKLKWRRAYYVPKVLTIKSKLKVEELRVKTLEFTRVGK